LKITKEEKEKNKYLSNPNLSGLLRAQIKIKRAVKGMNIRSNVAGNGVI